MILLPPPTPKKTGSMGRWGSGLGSGLGLGRVGGRRGKGECCGRGKGVEEEERKEKGWVKQEH